MVVDRGAIGRAGAAGQWLAREAREAVMTLDGVKPIVTPQSLRVPPACACLRLRGLQFRFRPNSGHIVRSESKQAFGDLARVDDRSSNEVGRRAGDRQQSGRHQATCRRFDDCDGLTALA
jgi:hypothetical protein